MITFDHPYEKLSGGTWVKGNLHTHTTNSDDGRMEPQEVIDKYALLGYRFLMISDHDYLTSQEELNRYDSRGMLLIPGNEISRNGPHLLHVNARSSVEAIENRQEVIDRIISDGGQAIVNHPNLYKDFNDCPQHSIDTWQGLTGIEIFNGSSHTLSGSAHATDRWDMVLAERKKIWGFAVDDSHDEPEIGRGWVTAYVQDLSVEAIVQSLKKGRFYSSTGVVIKNIEVGSDYIKIETKNAKKIVAVVDYNFRIKEVAGKTIRLDFDGTLPDTERFKATCHRDGKARYIRFECWGKPEQFAWTQPFFVRK